MNLRLTFVAITVGTLFGPVYLKFYLEKTRASFRAQLVKSNRNAHSHTEARNWDLYECEKMNLDYASDLEINCEPLDSFEKQQQVYDVANFYGVAELEVLTGHVVEIDGIKYVAKNVPAVLTVGVEPRNFHKPNFKPACQNTLYTEYKISRHLSRFVNFNDKAAMTQLYSFFSVNNIAYLRSLTANTPVLFASYATVLKRVVDAFEFKESATRKQKSTTISASQSQSKTSHGVLSWARTQSKSISRAVSKSFPKVPSLRRFQSTTRSWSLSRKLSHALQSRSLSSPRPRSPPVNLHQLKIDLLDAAVHLSQKMFDPCFLLIVGNEEKAQANSICRIYCQFLSAAVEVCDDVYSERCTDLKTGQCVNEMCVCETGGFSKRTVNMVFCNNAFRLQIYKEAS